LVVGGWWLIANNHLVPLSPSLSPPSPFPLSTDSDALSRRKIPNLLNSATIKLIASVAEVER
jgi:hypothetical protein